MATLEPKYDTAETPAQIEALVVEHVLAVTCNRCGKALNGEPYRQERWRAYHVKCDPPVSAWRQKALRAAAKAMKRNT